jgi:mannitol-1-phosphate/altronate dehydrogenase
LIFFLLQKTNQNNFPQGRPPWENVGVVLVEDVRPFELMKLRLLNGGHSVLAYLSYLMGYRYIEKTTI